MIVRHLGQTISELRFQVSKNEIDPSSTFACIDFGDSKEDIGWDLKIDLEKTGLILPPRLLRHGWEYKASINHIPDLKSFRDVLRKSECLITFSVATKHHWKSTGGKIATSYAIKFHETVQSGGTIGIGYFKNVKFNDAEDILDFDTFYIFDIDPEPKRWREFQEWDAPISINPKHKDDN